MQTVTANSTLTVNFNSLLDDVVANNVSVGKILGNNSSLGLVLLVKVGRSTNGGRSVSRKDVLGVVSLGRVGSNLEVGAVKLHRVRSCTIHTPLTVPPLSMREVRIALCFSKVMSASVPAFLTLKSLPQNCESVNELGA